MIRVKHGDLDKLAVLYERYSRALFGFFFKVTLDSQTSEDLVQTVFFKIIKYRDRYRAEEGSFVNWMFRIAHNANIDHYLSLDRRRNEVRIGEGLAVALSLIVMGWFLGYQVTPRPERARIDFLASEVREMKKTVMLAMLENSSAAERMKAVHFAQDLAARPERLPRTGTRRD